MTQKFEIRTENPEPGTGRHQRPLAGDSRSAVMGLHVDIPKVRAMLLIFTLLLTAICLTVTGELLLKSGMNQVGEFSASFNAVFRTFTEWRVLLGFMLIFGGGLFWLGVISRVDFSFAYPLLALSYVISLIPAHFLLGEHVTINRIIGACVIVLGVVIVTWRAPV